MEHDDTRPARRRPTTDRPMLLAGRFVDTATSTADELRVAVDDFDGGRQTHGPVRWRARPGVTGLVYPQAGDLAWIAEARGAELSEWVVVEWKQRVEPVPVAGESVTALSEVSVAALAAASPLVDHVVDEGHHVAGDGGLGVWILSSTQGVRGKPTVTNQGSGMPNGEYRVRLTGGGGTGATARVVISGGHLSVYVPSWSTSAADNFPDAIILEPGSGYTSPPALSRNPADWFLFHSNATPATFAGGAVFPVATFALADNLLSLRTANAREYLLQHNGRVDARLLGVKCEVDSIADAQFLQEAVRALMTGRSQIALEYGGGPSAGGIIEFPAAPCPLQGETIWVNSTGTPSGTEIVGFGFSGAARGSARTTRPDGAPSGTVFQYGKIVIGDPNSTGVFDTVSRGITMENFQLIGGMELYGVQHAFKFADVLINPDYPVGVVKSGVRVDGYGLTMKFCSTGLLERAFITGGDQVYFANDNELDGVLLDNCDQINGISMAASFCRRGLVITGGCTGLKFHSLTVEGNLLEDVILEDALDSLLSLTTLGRDTQDSTLPRVRIGDASDATTKCWAISVNAGSFSGNPKMIEQELYSAAAPGTVQLHHDYTHRYPVGALVILRDDTNGHVIRAVGAVSFDEATNLTTITFASGVTADTEALVLTGSLADIPLSGHSGTDTLLIAGSIPNDPISSDDLANLLAVGSWVTVRNATDGDFAAKVTAISYDAGTDTTSVTVSVSSVNANCTAVQRAYPGGGVAVQADYVTGLDMVANSVVNFATALKGSAHATELFYRRGRFTNTRTIQQIQKEIALDPAATWAPLQGDVDVSGVLSGKVRSLSKTTVTPSTVFIAGGVIIVTDSIHRIDTEAGAALDDLDTILWASGTPKYGQELHLETAIDSRDVRITAAGNIVGSGLPLTLVARQGLAHLVYNGARAKWVVQAFYNGA